MAASIFRLAPLALGAALLSVTLGLAAPIAAAPHCRPGQNPVYAYGFAHLNRLLGSEMGDPVECEHVDAASGDIHQRTATGLAYYRPLTNVPAFTDGSLHRAWTERGLVTWTGDASHPPGVPVAGARDTTGLAPPPLDLDWIFAENRPGHVGLDSDRLHTIVFTGDVGLVRMVNVTTVTSGDFLWPFRETAYLIRGADLAIANLEGPPVPGCPLRYTSLEFCGDPRNVQGLQYAGIDLAGLSNNHIRDHGQPGLDSTRDILEAAGIDHAGNGVASLQTIGDVRYGFLAFNALGPLDIEPMAAEIRALRVSVDVVAVIMHWGLEYTHVPAPSPGNSGAPRDIARAAIDAGADLVLGNHPHWVQAVELYKDGLIAYAHGNFGSGSV